MADEAMTDPFYASAPVVDDDNLAIGVRHFVLRYRVGVVLVDRATRHSAQVHRWTGCLPRPLVWHRW